MLKFYLPRFLFGFLFALPVIFIACSKGGGGGGGGGGNPNPCSGVTVSVTATTANPSAPGASDGTITASATGGSGFTYSLNGGPFQVSGSFTGLAAGTYAITAKNSNGCTGSASFTLVANNPCAGITITVTGTITHPTTVGGTNGSINATAAGSTGFTYSLNGAAFQASGNFTNLGQGVYTIVAKDLNGCTGSAAFTLTAPSCAGVVITVTGTFTNPTTPGGTNGSISATASGGTAPHTYSLNGAAFQASGNFTGLSAGTFIVTAKDAAGCTGNGSFTLTDPNPCQGVTITVSATTTGNTPCGPASGTITASASGGTGPYLFSLNGGSFQSNNVFSNLGAASYTIAARDANTCNGTTNAIVSNLPAGVLFSAVRAVLQNNCVTCHNPGNPNGGMDWTQDCNIVQFKDRIVARAVNANPSAMPPTGLLPLSERQKITDWVNAGGRFTD